MLCDLHILVCNDCNSEEKGLGPAYYFLLTLINVLLTASPPFCVSGQSIWWMAVSLADYAISERSEGARLDWYERDPWQPFSRRLKSVYGPFVMPRAFHNGSWTLSCGTHFRGLQGAQVSFGDKLHFVLQYVKMTTFISNSGRPFKLVYFETSISLM